jgi:murein DD-endopeptidase MepM/ murein hydrolase activator NlpD
MAETGQQSALDQIGKNPIAPQVNSPHITPPVQPQMQQSPQVQHPQFAQQAPNMQGTVLPVAAPITQHAGNYNPGVEVYSHGYARDTNFAVPAGTPAALPPGTWKVVNTYNQANPVGYLHNGENQGYGNDVVAVNTQTGDRIIEQHLSRVQAHPGQILQGGTVIGSTGSSGNTTGANLGIELTDRNGRIIDITRTPYMAGVMPQGRNSVGR